ncbi:hypothetical protein KC338_g23 [Hortaea werneckii]|nr:hypothetical protein KC338_g23 [Hortaea werneckii]
MRGTKQKLNWSTSVSTSLGSISCVSQRTYDCKIDPLSSEFAFPEKAPLGIAYKRKYPVGGRSKRSSFRPDRERRVFSG